MLKTVLATGSLVLMGALQSQAVLVDLAKWTFETSVPVTSGPFAAELGVNAATSAALGSHASGTTIYSNPAGNGSVESFSSDKWAVGDYYQFKVSTAGYTGITIGWDQTGSGTGPRDFELRYSVDGTTYSAINTYTVKLNGGPAAAWNSATGSPLYSFVPTGLTPAIASAIENQATLFLRLVDISTTSIAVSPTTGQVVQPGGTDRVDNFTVSGTLKAVVPEASTWFAGLGLSLGMLGSFVRKYRK